MKFSVILLFATMLASADAQEKIKFSISVSSKDFGLPAGMGGVQADFSSGKGPDVEVVRGAEKSVQVARSVNARASGRRRCYCGNRSRIGLAMIGGIINRPTYFLMAAGNTISLTATGAAA